ncbi:MAG: hypothetical protein KDK41_15110 [Leptospiraceae bacterium]|nr:hypothetical protein [Leptospiraceae bacterium]
MNANRMLLPAKARYDLLQRHSNISRWGFNLRIFLLVSASTLAAVLQPVIGSGYSEEKIRGIGLGMDFHTNGRSPAYAVGALWGGFGIISYHARLNIAYRPGDETTLIRGGLGAGLILPLLNLDLTYQAGRQNSAGVFAGLSAFLTGSNLTPEVYLGYQFNFSARVENYFLLGAKLYWNMSEY